MIENPLFYPIAVLAVLIVGVSKSGFGGGLGVLAVPLMSLIVPPLRAAAILLPLLVVMDGFTVWHYRKSWDKRNLLILLPAAILGIVLGSLFFKDLSDAHIRIMVGILAVLFVMNYFIKPGTKVHHNSKVFSGFFWGTVAGFTSFGVHAGGPPVNMYLLPQRLPKSIFVGTTVVFFTIVNLLKILPYALLGQFKPETLLTSLVLAPLAPLGVWLGVKLHHRIREQLFYTLCYLFLLVTGVKLLYDGFNGL